ncbi:MAG TPA: hypothetical protein VN844_02440 [Pyrinomonadaceae bacterium]|nr:hypothetical protein [Pyrinomonadaceae bacterium]
MNRKPNRNESLVLLLLLVAICATVAQAQSGRRQPKPPPSAPVPTPTPEPTPAPKQQQQKELDLGFVIGSDRFGSTTENYPISYYDAAMVGCADQLRSGSSAAVSVSQSNMSRGEAIKKAKAESKTYVVWMRLVLDQMTARSLDDLEIEFVVFSPQTAKVVITGRSYLNVNRKGPIIVGPTSRGPTGALYREELIRRAGEDAGERILKALHLDTPVLRQN